jgi:hypothetical protein
LNEPKEVVVYKKRIEPWLLLGAEEFGLTSYVIYNLGPEYFGLDYVFWFVIMNYDAKLCEMKIKELQEEGRQEREAIGKREQEERLERETKQLVRLDRKTHADAPALQIGDSWDHRGIQNYMHGR